MTCEHVEVQLWPWLTLELPREVVEGLTPGELADCCDAARCEVVRLLRLRAGGPDLSAIADTPLPATESQARELVGLPAETAVEAYS